MSGTILIAPRQRTTGPGTVIPPDVTVRVELVGGVLAVNVPPGEYELHAQLYTADGAAFSDGDIVTV
jgi:hypothetical protein